MINILIFCGFLGAVVIGIWWISEGPLKRSPTTPPSPHTDR